MSRFGKVVASAPGTSYIQNKPKKKKKIQHTRKHVKKEARIVVISSNMFMKIAAYLEEHEDYIGAKEDYKGKEYQEITNFVADVLDVQELTLPVYDY